MRIALVNQWYPPNFGGVAVYNHVMAKAWSRRGHEVTVITSAPVNAQSHLSQHDDVSVYRLKQWVEPYAARRLPLLGRYVRTLRHLIYSRRVSNLLRHLIQAGGVDVVEFAEINAEGIDFVRRHPQVPVVVRCHTPHFLLQRTAPDKDWDMSLIGRIETDFVRRASAVTAPSADLATEIEREMGLPDSWIQVIPNPIDVHEFSPGESDALSVTTGEVTILYVGRLGQEKGILDLADAVARLAGSETKVGHPRWRVVFAGDDRPLTSGESARRWLERFFEEHGLSHRVEIRGHVSQESLIQLYRSSDVCIVPSTLYESFSYTCIQAMACAKPVLATRIGGIPEVVIDGETGLLVPPADPASLADALGRLIADAGLRQRLGRAGRTRVLEHYADTVCAQATLALYHRVIADWQHRTERQPP